MQYDKLIRQKRDYFEQGKTDSLKFRKEKLQLLKNILLEKEDVFAEALHHDLKKPKVEVTFEIIPVLEEIDHHLKKLDKWIKPESVRSNLVSFPSSNEVHRVPYGVVLIIGAWNYPVQLTLMPLAGAISGGNCAVLKPSELTPATSGVLRELINDTFEPGYINVVEGDADTGSELLAQPFDKIFFTGSTRVGKIVMEKAAQNLTPVTLEMGGKSPAVVHKDTDVKTAARRICWGKFLNAGQTCISPDYALVHRDVKDDFIKHAGEAIKMFYGDDPQQSDEYARIVNRQHFQRLTALLDGLSIVHGGKHDEAECYIEPTIADESGWEHPVMKEEIFGPILPVMTYDDRTSPIQLLQGKPAPLAFYIFSEDKSFIKNLTRRIPHGGACINDVIMQISNTNLPFGGAGSSGMGQYHGRYSFECFTRPQALMYRKIWPDPAFRYPPFGNKLNLIKKLIMR